MKTAVIISGGSLNPDCALAFLRKEEPEILIGADRGICFLRDKGIRPTHIVGDFDSASGDALEYFRRFPELGAERIFILGGTGTRLDHVVANIKLLAMALEQGKECILLDEHNRIRLTDQPMKIRKTEQYGKYVSLFAFGGQVTGLTLRGFFYPLTEYDMTPENPIGVSNEITAENGEISFSSGMLLVMESKD